MTKMTYVAAIEAALTYLPDEIDDDVRERLTALRDQLAKQKQATDAKRRVVIEPILPIIRAVIENEPLTVKEIWERTYGKIPTDFSPSKVQYVLTHELADEVVRIDNGHSKPYTYQLKTKVEEG